MVVVVVVAPLTRPPLVVVVPGLAEAAGVDEATGALDLAGVLGAGVAVGVALGAGVGKKRPMRLVVALKVANPATAKMQMTIKPVINCFIWPILYARLSRRMGSGSAIQRFSCSDDLNKQNCRIADNLN